MFFPLLLLWLSFCRCETILLWSSYPREVFQVQSPLSFFSALTACRWVQIVLFPSSDFFVSSSLVAVVFHPPRRIMARLPVTSTNYGLPSRTHQVTRHDLLERTLVSLLPCSMPVKNSNWSPLLRYHACRFHLSLQRAMAWPSEHSTLYETGSTWNRFWWAFYSLATIKLIWLILNAGHPSIPSAKFPHTWQLGMYDGQTELSCLFDVMWQLPFLVQWHWHPAKWWQLLTTQSSLVFTLSMDFEDKRWQEQSDARLTIYLGRFSYFLLLTLYRNFMIATRLFKLRTRWWICQLDQGMS